MAIRKPESGEKSVSKRPHVDSGDFVELYPVTADVLWGSSWEDGTARLPSKLSVYVFMGRLMAQIDLADTGMMVRMEVPGPLVLWDALEAFLTGDPVPWEENPWLKNKGPRKGK